MSTDIRKRISKNIIQQDWTGIFHPLAMLHKDFDELNCRSSMIMDNPKSIHLL